MSEQERMAAEATIPMPGSRLWFEKLALEISGVERIEVFQLSPGKILLRILLDNNGSIKRVSDELSNRLRLQNLIVEFECKVVFLKQIEEFWLNRGHVTA